MEQTKTDKKTISVTWEPATKFSWKDNGKLYIGYIDEKFEYDLYDDTLQRDLQTIIDNADFIEMGYNSNVVFVIKKRIHHIEIRKPEVKKDDCE